MLGVTVLIEVQILIKKYIYFHLEGDKISEFNLSLISIDSENLDIPNP